MILKKTQSPKIIRNFSTNPKLISGSQTAGTWSACLSRPLYPHSRLPISHVQRQTSNTKRSQFLKSDLRITLESWGCLNECKRSSQQLPALYWRSMERRAQTRVGTHPTAAFSNCTSGLPRVRRTAGGSLRKWKWLKPSQLLEKAFRSYRTIYRMLSLFCI